MTVLEINAFIAPSIRKYTLTQAVRVSASYLRDSYPKESAETLYERLKFRANSSLAFQKSEVSKMEFVETPNGRLVEITLNFLGIFGSASPLPSHYSEMVLRSLDGDKILHDFLNIFNHHLQKLVYQVWEKQRYYIQYQHDLQDKFSKYMLSLLGLYDQSSRPDLSLDLRRLMPYIGILSMRQKSSGTLVAILRHYLEHDDIEIVQCVTTEVGIPSFQQASLGQKNMQLGRNMLLGKSIKTKGAKFQILLNNVSFDQLYDYSLHGKKMQELNELIKFAMSEPLEYEVCLSLSDESEMIKGWHLGEHHLGVNAWMGENSYDKKIVVKN